MDKNLLKNHKPIILMELAPYVLEEQGDSFKELIGFLTDLHYRFYQLGNYQELAASSLGSLPSGSSINVIARV